MINRDIFFRKLSQPNLKWCHMIEVKTNRCHLAWHLFSVFSMAMHNYFARSGILCSKTLQQNKGLLNGQGLQFFQQKPSKLIFLKQNGTTGQVYFCRLLITVAFSQKISSVSQRVTSHNSAQQIKVFWHVPSQNVSHLIVQESKTYLNLCNCKYYNIILVKC